MSKLTSMVGKTKEVVTLSNGETIELLPPKVSDLPELISVFKGKKEGEEMSFSGEEFSAVIKVIKSVLKRSVPDATDEEIEEVLLTDMGVILEGLTKLINRVFGGMGKK